MSDNKELVVETGSTGRAGQIVFSGARGSLVFEKFGEMVDFSIYMSKADKAVPAFLRGNPGSCMAIVVQAGEWGFSPFAVARMAYVVNDQIAYMSQLLHAVVEKRANLKERLRPTYSGEGIDRQVTITGHFVGELDAVSYTSPKIRDIKVKNSPLWVGDPDQQLFYFGTRAWSRRYCPDVLLGVYSVDDLPGEPTQHVGAENAKDVTPDQEGLVHRLSAKAAAGAGFDPVGVAATLSEAGARAPSGENSSDVRRTTLEAQAAVSEPTSPAGIAQTAADPSPVGSTSGVGAQASEPAAPQPTAGAAGEPPKRRGRPPKSAGAPVEPASNSQGVESTPATNAKLHDELEDQGEVESHVGDLENNEPSLEPLPVEVAPPQSPAPETVADPVSATVEKFVDDDLPSFDDRVPDPPAQEELPDLPTDGRYYPGYVRKMLMHPSMSEEAAVRTWWGSMEQKKMRNGMPNYTDEFHQKTMGIVTEHLKKVMENSRRPT